MNLKKIKKITTVTGLGFDTMEVEKSIEYKGRILCFGIIDNGYSMSVTDFITGRHIAKWDTRKSSKSCFKKAFKELEKHPDVNYNLFSKVNHISKLGRVNSALDYSNLTIDDLAERIKGKTGGSFNMDFQTGYSFAFSEQLLKKTEYQSFHSYLSTVLFNLIY